MSEQQAKEIKTIKERTFQISLSDADVVRLLDKSAIAGMSPAELLGSFIGDLVNGTYSNGSDERMCATNWFERCGFGYWNKNFIQWLIENYQLEEIAVMWDDLEDLKSDLKLYNGSEDILSNFESIKEYEEEKQFIFNEILEYENEIQKTFDSYVEETKSKLIFEEEIKKVMEFYKERERVMIGN